jgi:hypothetical protein
VSTPTILQAKRTSVLLAIIPSGNKKLGRHRFFSLVRRDTCTVSNSFELTLDISELTPNDNVLVVTNAIEPPLLAILNAIGLESVVSAMSMVFVLTLSGAS